MRGEEAISLTPDTCTEGMDVLLLAKRAGGWHYPGRSHWSAKCYCRREAAG
jgi:hypothetical protein